MKKFLSFLLFSFLTCIIPAQNKRVLLEEFTGAHCGQCPMGSYTLDSLLGVYPELIGVSLHTYSIQDAMFFPQIDTIGTSYAPGAPVGATDRIYWGSWPYVAETSANWNARIQARLAVAPQLSVIVNATWNSVTRNITTQITTNILSNMATGDYRFNLYVVEDSVTGTGSGYDQSNIYNGVSGNPFYGLGDPIVGYVHRHVVRAILPQSWGQSGLISSAPMMGQNFSTTMNYTLPASYNENRVKLVAFVSEFTANHQGDEVFNVAEADLLSPSGIDEGLNEDIVSVCPNPSNGIFNLITKVEMDEIILSNILGEVVLRKKLTQQQEVIDVSDEPAGIYILHARLGSKSTMRKLIIH